MTDHATEHARIHAPLQRCFDALCDFERYPAWASDIKAAEVHRRDDHGRGVEVTWRAAAMGRSTTVRLRYDYAGSPGELRWELIDGDMLRRYDGHYRLTAVPDDEASTDVEYELSVDLVVPVPGFVKRRAEARIMKAALPDLKAYLESDRDRS